jgi:hypothetical protein
VTATVMGDDAIAVLHEEHHLRVPVISTRSLPPPIDKRLSMLVGAFRMRYC